MKADLSKFVDPSTQQTLEVSVLEAIGDEDAQIKYLNDLLDEAKKQATTFEQGEISYDFKKAADA